MELREFRAELPSTQTEAVRRAREGAPEGTRIVAARQTAGCGRGSHEWASPEGNLYLSLIVRAPESHLPLLSLAVGARLRAALSDRYGVVTVLKWPNDLLVLGRGAPRKLAGVLVDLVPSPAGGRSAVIGIGVNVAASTDDYPTALRDRIVGLSELASDPPLLPEVEELTGNAVSSALRSLDRASAVEDLLDECRSALHGVGRTATVDDALTGVIRGLGEEGELWLDTPSGTISVRAGTVVVESS